MLVCGGGGMTTNMHACVIIDGANGKRSLGVVEVGVTCPKVMVMMFLFLSRRPAVSTTGPVVRTVDVPVTVITSVVTVTPEGVMVTGNWVVTSNVVNDPTTMVSVVTGVKVEKPVVVVLVMTVPVVV